MTDVGFIGLGSMGAALAGQLVGKVPLAVFDLDAHRRAKLVGEGARDTASVGELARSVDVVLICLPTSTHVEEVVLDDGGVLSGLAPGSLLVDCTSGDLAVSRTLADRLAEKGIGFVDAPVSGGPRAGADGTIAIMMGGSQSNVARAELVLRAISPNVCHVGPWAAVIA